jgi:hypothetical protein
MWGAQDTWVPLSMGERFRQDIAGSELIVYPNLGHLPMEEDPMTTARDAMAFLRRRVLDASPGAPAASSLPSAPLQTPALTGAPAQK